MLCRSLDLRYKEIICVSSGQKFGRADDIEFCTETAQVKAIIIFGRRRFWGLLGREEDIVIPWCDIKCLGEDVILVKSVVYRGKRPSLLSGLFE